MVNLNPMFNEQRRHRNTKNDRKTRSDKKADIRVPVTVDDYEFIKWNARSKKQSITRFCTDIVTTQIKMNQEFHEHTYLKTGYEVHIKPEEELYQKIVEYSILWEYGSIRETAHRILTDSIFYIRGGIHFEGI